MAMMLEPVVAFPVMGNPHRLLQLQVQQKCLRTLQISSLKRVIPAIGTIVLGSHVALWIKEIDGGGRVAAAAGEAMEAGVMRIVLSVIGVLIGLPVLEIPTCREVTRPCLSSDLICLLWFHSLVLFRFTNISLAPWLTLVSFCLYVALPILCSCLVNISVRCFFVSYSDIPPPVYFFPSYPHPELFGGYPFVPHPAPLAIQEPIFLASAEQKRVLILKQIEYYFRYN